ncbi:oxygen-independent coproporphyrinogen III oxidase [Sansalvadorimonas verongulae]|uniref:oxygen-independent coproporphyrinogen III oxidase n=1 Tax=Sansalvadorimonas verongulae TaxID=2172824 RepID=UPI0012BCD1A3|nr:oxygen-independent coproporphyrinogen III oxidase [Sansalvadorimonas verongulae]MTI12656.1 oxygen-independent coproporphyrinogen III oxidase [Sansalvadorimonas verongulae]
MNHSLIWDSSLLKRYDRPGPRYTSYPTAVQFTSEFSADTFTEAERLSGQEQRPVSLYFHIPFCDTVCFYCGCNKIVTKRREQAQPYLDLMCQEMAMHAENLGYRAKVEQLHLGGGTPTFLSKEQLSQLMECADKYFDLDFGDFSDYSIEIDPREADWAMMGHLRDLGFNRISLGVQDFDPAVQKAVNRIQPAAMTESLMDAAHVMNFKSINLDLIYGLPLQNCKSFLKTVDRVIELQPERLSVFNYAHLPHRFMPQRRIRDEDLPSPEEKLRIMEATTQRLTEAGYVYIGMDHFALPDDDLAAAQEEGVLHRNFQGYTTHGHCDLIGIGVSSISQVGDTYAQNFTDMPSYVEMIEAGKLAINKGYKSNSEDQLRAHVIRRLLCDFHLSFQDVDKLFGINFLTHFQRELDELRVMADDGLLTLDDTAIHVQPRGRLLIRNICMTFDEYMAAAQAQKKFSRVI